MKRFIGSKPSFVAFMLLCSFSLTGCKKEIPNPESLDPIFADLDKRATEAQKSFEAELKNQVEARAALEKAEPNSIELKNAQKDLAKSQVISLDMEQKAKYYKIRAQRRLLVDRISYKTALAKNEVWPDPHEYSEYLVNMRLQDSPKNWNIRVPKLQDRLAKAGVSVKKEEKREAKAEE